MSYLHCNDGVIGVIGKEVEPCGLAGGDDLVTLAIDEDHVLEGEDVVTICCVLHGPLIIQIGQVRGFL